MATQNVRNVTLPWTVGTDVFPAQTGEYATATVREFISPLLPSYGRQRWDTMVEGQYADVEAELLYYTSIFGKNKYLNRGRDSVGGGYVYWESYDYIDVGGAYYPYISPPWGDIVEVVGVDRFVVVGT